MPVIPREAGRVTYSAEIRDLKKRLRLTEEQKAVLIGTMLGDGHLAENWSKTNYRLKVSQSKEQEEYVLWKYRVFKDFVLTGPRLHVSTNSVRFATMSHPEFTVFRNLFYQGRRKIIPSSLHQLLTPLALAVWFMDDGNCKGAGLNLNTQSFSQSENLILKKYFKEVHGIDVTLERNHKYFRLYFRRASADQLRHLINSSVLPSMRYKLG
jgi:hypothetical protein